MNTVLVLVPERPEWYARANCAGVGPERFYVERGASTAQALKICGGCEVRGECLAHALAVGERFGIWGGRSVRNRMRGRGDRRQAS